MFSKRKSRQEQTRQAKNNTTDSVAPELWRTPGPVVYNAPSDRRLLLFLLICYIMSSTAME